MKRWYITYRSSDNDISRIWLTATSKEQAISEAKREYWDIEEIIDCWADR